MNSNAISAIEALQADTSRELRQPEGEVLEEALGDLVRNPDRSADPKHQAGSAIARARTKVMRRRKLLGPVLRLDADPTAPTAQLPVERPATVDDVAKHDELLDRDALERGLSSRDLFLLDLVGRGFTASEIAELESIDPARIRVRVSRARARARKLRGALT